MAEMNALIYAFGNDVRKVGYLKIYLLGGDDKVGKLFGNNNAVLRVD
jgi:hypothetical protein